MQGSLFNKRAKEPAHPVSPLQELGAYELLWARPHMSVKKLAQLFRENPGALPSDLVDHGEALEMGRRVFEMLLERGVRRFGISIHNAGEYPAKLRDAQFPLEMLYYQGWWNFVESPAVAVVGTREPSPEGVRRARKVAQQLVEDGKTVVSGLAAGIDTAAHMAAIDAGGRTIAVIGTPLGEFYPKENRDLQNLIAEKFLVISQVPVYRHSLGHGWDKLRAAKFSVRAIEQSTARSSRHSRNGSVLRSSLLVRLPAASALAAWRPSRTSPTCAHCCRSGAQLLSASRERRCWPATSAST